MRNASISMVLVPLNALITNCGQCANVVAVYAPEFVTVAAVLLDVVDIVQDVDPLENVSDTFTQSLFTAALPVSV